MMSFSIEQDLYLDPLASGEARLFEEGFKKMTTDLDPLASGEARQLDYEISERSVKFRSTSLRRG